MDEHEVWWYSLSGGGIRPKPATGYKQQDLWRVPWDPQQKPIQGSGSRRTGRRLSDPGGGQNIPGDGGHARTYLHACGRDCLEP